MICPSHISCCRLLSHLAPLLVRLDGLLGLGLEHPSDLLLNFHLDIPPCTAARVAYVRFVLERCVFDWRRLLFEQKNEGILPELSLDLLSNIDFAESGCGRDRSVGNTLDSGRAAMETSQSAVKSRPQLLPCFRRKVRSSYKGTCYH